MAGRIFPTTHTGITAEHEKKLRRHPGAVASVIAGLTVNGARDRYVITDTAATDYPLSYVPVANTINLFLNGVALDEGIDYTVDYTVPSFTLTADAVRADDDVLWARYLTLNPVAAEIQTTLTWGIRSGVATIIGLTDAVALIDSGVAFTDIEADLVPASGKETSLVFGATSITPGVDGSYLLLRVNNATPGLYRFDRISGVDGDTMLKSIPACTGSGTYRVENTGGTLTVLKDASTLDSYTTSGGDLTALSRTLVGIRASESGGATSFDNFTANGGVVADDFDGPDADQLGVADTGQVWQGTS